MLMPVMVFSLTPGGRLNLVPFTWRAISWAFPGLIRLATFVMMLSEELVLSEELSAVRVSVLMVGSCICLC